MIITTNMIAATNGKTPRNTSSICISLSTPATTNRLRPNGGVIRPTSIIKTEITPNQTGSKPDFTTRGKITGNVSTIIEMASKKHPKIK